MPNHCYQSVYLAGNPKEIDRLYKAVKEERLLDEVIPQPKDMFHGLLGDEERKMCEDKKIPNWYDWRLENWDTKWDICDVQITDEIAPLPSSDKFYFNFSCWTAWSPPVPVWNKLHEQGIEFNVDFYDEGAAFEGEYKDGQYKDWEPEFDDEDDFDEWYTKKEEAHAV